MSPTPTRHRHPDRRGALDNRMSTSCFCAAFVIQSFPSLKELTLGHEPEALNPKMRNAPSREAKVPRPHRHCRRHSGQCPRTTGRAGGGFERPAPVFLPACMYVQTFIYASLHDLHDLHARLPPMCPHASLNSHVYPVCTRAYMDGRAHVPIPTEAVTHTPNCTLAGTCRVVECRSPQLRL